MMKMRRLLCAAAVAVLLFTGCNAHVDNTKGAPPEGTLSVTQAGVTFLVPEAAYNGAVDYHTYTDTVYATQKAIDAARIELANTAVYGTQGTDYLLTSNKKFFFYVLELTDMTVLDITKLTRDDLVCNLGIKNFEVKNYGRMIANGDDTPKAIVRADFSSIGFNGAEYIYSGYIGFAEIDGVWHGYIAGYTDATEKDIALTRELVKSMQ